MTMFSATNAIHTYTSGTAASNQWVLYSPTATGATTASTYIAWDTTNCADVVAVAQRKLSHGMQYELPDGALLDIDDLGNYKIQDQHAKVIYRANRVREFNRYLNASDLLEAFIDDVGKLDGVDQTQVLRLPIEAFINWLILQAATKDGDPTDHLPSVAAALPSPKSPDKT